MRSGDVAAVVGKGLFAGAAGMVSSTLEAKLRRLVSAGPSGPAATAVRLAPVWGSEQVVLPALGVAPPLTGWRDEEVCVDASHQFVYAAGILFAGLMRQGYFDS